MQARPRGAAAVMFSRLQSDLVRIGVLTSSTVALYDSIHISRGICSTLVCCWTRCYAAAVMMCAQVKGDALNSRVRDNVMKPVILTYQCTAYTV
jgi:hypothetical protein